MFIGVCVHPTRASWYTVTAALPRERGCDFIGRDIFASVIDGYHMLVRVEVGPAGRQHSLQGGNYSSPAAICEMSLRTFGIDYGEDVHIFQLLGLRVPCIAAREEVVQQLPGGFDVITYELMPRLSELALGLCDLQVGFQSVESLIDVAHVIGSLEVVAEAGVRVWSGSQCPEAVCLHPIQGRSCAEAPARLIRVGPVKAAKELISRHAWDTLKLRQVSRQGGAVSSELSITFPAASVRNRELEDWIDGAAWLVAFESDGP